MSSLFSFILQHTAREISHRPHVDFTPRSINLPQQADRQNPQTKEKIVMTFSGLDWYWWLAIVAALTGLFIGRISNGLMVGVVYSKRHNNFLFPVSLTIIKSSTL